MTPEGHINFYTQETFSHLLETCGLKVVKLRVYPYSDDYAGLEGRFGRLKNRIRGAVLNIWPAIAMRHWVFVCAALCDT